MRLGSVTHCRNMNQSLMFLEGFTQTELKLTVPAPANANLAPPGHYMLFALNAEGVPSEARIMRISATAAPTLLSESNVSLGVRKSALHTATSEPIQHSLTEHNQKVIDEEQQPPVVVGFTPLCPYGLGPCWAGAYDALKRMNDIELVRPMPDQTDSIAFVFI